MVILYRIIKPNVINRGIKLLFLFLISNYCSAFNDKDTIRPGSYSKYIIAGGGAALTTIRDYGTSPLFYNGIFPTLKLQYNQRNYKNIFNILLQYSNGTYLRNTNDDSFRGSATVFDIRLNYMRNSGLSDNQKIKHFFGASLDNYMELRIMPAFMNASSVFENFTTFKFDYKFELFHTRKARRVNFLGLFAYNRKEKDYSFSCDVGIPIYILVYRPGFSYIGNGTINNDKLFRDYKFGSTFFSGLNTDISVSRLFKNGNIIKYSYYWNMFSTGKASSDKLNNARHLLMISLILKLD